MSAPDRRSPCAGSSLREGGAATGAPLLIAERFATLVQVTARKGRQAELATALESDLALDLPAAGGSATAGSHSAIWLQPGCWLLQAPAGKADFAATLAARLAGIAAVVDQSHGRCVLRLSGPRVREVLARSNRLDLHPRSFGVGSSAVTLVGHVSCVMHQIDETPCFDLIVGSTFSGWLLDQLAAASDGFGWRFERAGAEPAP